jgi:hypothetical protein
MLHFSWDVDVFGDTKPNEFDETLFAVVAITGLLLAGVTINVADSDEVDGSKPNEMRM